MTRRGRLTGVLLLLGGLLLLATAGWVALDRGRSVPPTPTTVLTPWPTFTPYQAPTTAPTEGTLLVSCNAPADLRLADALGQEVGRAQCNPTMQHMFRALRYGRYVLHATGTELGLDLDQAVDVEQAGQELTLLFPGLLEVAPVPAEAQVNVDGQGYQGLTRVSYPAAQCPLTTTFWVNAEGYAPYGTSVMIEAGEVYRQEVALEPLPTAPPATAGPTRAPVTAGPTTAPFSVEERVELVRQKLYEKVNCWRAEAGLAPLPYLPEWQALADDFATGWRDYFRQYGPNGFDTSPWRQQFQAAGGDAVPDSAAVSLYAPDYYINTAPKTHWDTFNMCDPSCPQYGTFQMRKSDFSRASGVVIGIVPWWDGDILSAAVVIGLKW